MLMPEKLNKTAKPLARLIRQEERTQTPNITNERGDIKVGSIGTKRIFNPLRSVKICQ